MQLAVPCAMGHLCCRNAAAPSSPTSQVHWRLITGVCKLEASSLPFTAEVLALWVLIAQLVAADWGGCEAERILCQGRRAVADRADQVRTCCTV